MLLRRGAVEFIGRHARREPPVQTPGNTGENTGTFRMSMVDTAGPVWFPAWAQVRKTRPARGLRFAQPFRQFTPVRGDASGSRSAESRASGTSS